MAGVSRVDLNCDMGESFGVYTLGNDADMLKIVTSANVACGFHAGDPLVIDRTVRLALEAGVAVGAHPSFLDQWGFGRRPILGEDPADIEKMLVYQIGAVQALASAVGHRVTHVKAHGSLGNMAAVDADLALACARAVRAVDRDLICVVMPGMETERAAERMGLRAAREIYADRTYDDNGNLTSRKKPGAVLHDPGEAADRIVRMLEEEAIPTVSGARIPARIDTICVHGDNPQAVAMARTIRGRLEALGVAVEPFSRTLA
ncbi:5-oxoprolinase subunit PxpA [Skermanella rosea]|uniref:LamB/YcsF family protein n=1 Tax=Skermanella rosea TaxID=1817965 RepID=UPI001933E322|nr:5-oxoprolinase subunit PxpA [Skermanella rosea]UEM02747.1 5-oxoprolinase subunit PxpA [Skermanella rosea]